MASIARPKIIHGIIGGVGPMAGVKLHEKLIEFTPTDGTDQSHLCVHHISQSQYIPDRTRFLLERLQQQQGEMCNTTTTQSAKQGSKRKLDQMVPSDRQHQQGKNACELPNPGHGALSAVKSLIDSTVVDHKLIIGVPCNTFHSPIIWTEFENGIKSYVMEISKKNKVQVQLLHMVQETVEYIFNILRNRILLNSHDDCEDVKEMEINENGKDCNTIYKIGLLSTKGTRDTKVYHNVFEALNSKHACTSTSNFTCEIIYLPDHLQDKLSNAIYNKEYGIKAKSRPCVDARVIEDMHTCCEYFINNHGCDIIILGCTELPLALPATNSYTARNGATNVHLVDPVEILAKAYIREHICCREMENGIIQRVVSYNNKLQEKK